jgi:hypothetical protein
MRKAVASCLLALACGCASGDDSATAPDDAATVDDGETLADAPSADTSSTHDSSFEPDSSLSVGGGADAEAGGGPDDAEEVADSARPVDATTADTGTDSGTPDSGAIDSSFDAPATAAPTSAPAAPTAPSSTVISLYSAAYTGGTANGDYSGNVDSYDATCFGPPGTSVTNYAIAGTTPSAVVLEYVLPASSFGIIELIGATGGTGTPAICNGGTQTGTDEVDATAMNHVHVDVWSPEGTTNFQVHLVGADSTKTIAGPGGAAGATAGTDYASPAISVAPHAWVGVDLSMSQLGPAGAPSLLSRLALVKLFSASAGTFFIDNVYLYAE